MPYTKHNWAPGDVLTEARMDNLETQYDEAIAEAHPVFTELAGGEDHAVTISSTWEDWDISGIIPVEAIYALLSLNNHSAGLEDMGARKNGTALVRLFETAEGGTSILLTEVDANRKVELWDSQATQLGNFSVVGYWVP